jgi:hypothetical protein
MNNDLTEIVMVVDRSGSMTPLREDAIGGFNTFLADQQALPGEANLTLVLFNTAYQMIHNGVAIKDVAPLTHSTYVPSGSTALLDALGKAINQTGARLAAMDEASRPGKVILVVLTDGEENSSREFTKAQITEMIQHQQDKYAWQVIFLSSDLNAVQEAKTLGVMNCCAFAVGSVGTRDAYGTASRSVTSYRTSGAVVDSSVPKKD